MALVWLQRLSNNHIYRQCMHQLDDQVLCSVITQHSTHIPIVFTPLFLIQQGFSALIITIVFLTVFIQLRKGHVTMRTPHTLFFHTFT